MLENIDAKLSEIIGAHRPNPIRINKINIINNQWDRRVILKYDQRIMLLTRIIAILFYFKFCNGEPMSRPHSGSWNKLYISYHFSSVEAQRIEFNRIHLHNLACTLIN